MPSVFVLPGALFRSEVGGTPPESGWSSIVHQE